MKHLRKPLLVSRLGELSALEGHAQVAVFSSVVVGMILNSRANNRVP